MCLKTDCKYIEIVEIKDDVKVVLHYAHDGTPVFIQYWNYNNGIDAEYLPKKSKNNRTRKIRQKIKVI